MSELTSLLTAYSLKDERRTGWELRGVADPESVAGHTWGVSLLCLCYAERADVDAGHALRLAVVHDLAEAEVGDIPQRADPAAETVSADEKFRREQEAMTDFAAALTRGDEILDLWEEYEERETPEAQFVKDMDLVDMCLQALYYERTGRYEPGEADSFEEYERLDEFFATAEPRLRTDVGHDLFEQIRDRYGEVRG